MVAEGILLDALSLPGLMETAVGISQTWAMKPCWHVLPPQMHPAENTHFVTCKVSRCIIPLNVWLLNRGIVDSFLNLQLSAKKEHLGWIRCAIYHKKVKSVLWMYMAVKGHLEKHKVVSSEAFPLFLPYVFSVFSMSLVLLGVSILSWCFLLILLPIFVCCLFFHSDIFSFLPLLFYPVLKWLLFDRYLTVGLPTSVEQPCYLLPS